MGSSVRVDAHRFSTDEERAAIERRDRVNAEAREHWGEPQFMAEIAETITETIYWGFEHENLLQLMTDLQNVGKFDRVTVSEVRGMRATWLARGGYIEQSTINKDVVELERDIVGFHVGDHTDKFQGNFYESQSDLTDLGIKRMDAAVNQRFFAGLQDAVDVSSDFYFHDTGLDLTTLDAAIDGVADQTEDGMITVVARRPMTGQIVTQLLNIGGQGIFAPETNERLLALGIQGVYRGARIVQLINYKDDLEIPFLPANELWVVGRDASRSAFWGGLESKEFEEDDDWYWHYLAKREFGMMVHRPNRLRRIVDDAISPTQGSGGSFTFP